jgi:hypothetical protein
MSNADRGRFCSECDRFERHIDGAGVGRRHRCTAIIYDGEIQRIGAR